MTIKFIGTGSGCVSSKQYHSSYLIESKKFKILFDCGDGISKALLENSIEYNSITHIIISHNHPDHLSGLPNLVNQMYIENRKSDLTIIAYKGLINNIKLIMDLTYVFPEKLKFKLNFLAINYQKVYSIGDLKFIAVKNNHISNKYEINRLTSDVFNSASFLFTIRHKKLLLTSDINNLDDLQQFRDEIFDMLILDSAHIELKDIHNYSFTLNAKAIYLTHYDKANQKKLREFAAQFKEKLKVNIQLAKEKLEIVI